MYVVILCTYFFFFLFGNALSSNLFERDLATLNFCLLGNTDSPCKELSGVLQSSLKLSDDALPLRVAENPLLI